ncbi:MAG: TIGR00730 family Rossman fold protein [Pseudomonadota bacterium]
MSTPRVTICVFCGSRPGKKDVYRATAEALGTGLAEAGFDLVYGAGDLGLMGLTARSAKAAGGHVTGFIPRHLFERELGTYDIDALVITETMHERKKLMFGNSDAIVTLPGGPGTLDELIEVLTWRQLGLHERPVILVGPEGYWDPFLALLDHIIEQGFCDASFRSYATLVETAEQAIEILRDAFPATD